MDVLSKLTGSKFRILKAHLASPGQESGTSGPRETYTPAVEADHNLIKPGMADKPKEDKVNKMLDTISSPEGTFTMAVGAILLSAAAALLRRRD